MSSVAENPRRRLSADEFERMVAVGVIDEDEKVELLEGELVTMSPQGPPHAALTAAVHQLLEAAYGPGFHVRDHSPIDAGPESRPEPDLVVVRGSPRDYVGRHPRGTDILLVAEMASSTRAVDRRKARVYARGGVGTYWIVDLTSSQVEVRSRPETGGDYAALELMAPGQQVALPEIKAQLPVAELLP